MPTPYWEALFNAMYVQTQKEADEALEKLIVQCHKEDPTLGYETCKAIQLSNLGWMFGEVAPETRLHAMKLYPEAKHPIFGRHFGYSPEQVIKAGMTVGQAMHQGHTISEAVEMAQEQLNEPTTESHDAPADN